MKKVILFFTLILLLTSCGEKSIDINKKDKEILQEEVSTNTHITTSSAPSMETTKVTSIDKGIEKNKEVSNITNISSMNDCVGIFCYDYEDDTTDLIEDHYIVIENVSGQIMGRYYGTSDDFDEAREGYYPGFFVADMSNLKINNKEITFEIFLTENDIFSKPVKLKYKCSKDVPLSGNPLWINKQIIDGSDKNHRKYQGKIVNGEIILKVDESQRIFKKIEGESKNVKVNGSKVEPIKDEDLQLSKHKLAMSIDKFIKDMPKKLKKKSSTYDDSIEMNEITFEFEDGTIYVFLDDELYSISTQNPEYSTPRGLRVGDSVKKVIELYGNPQHKSKDGCWEYTYEGAEDYTLFYITVANDKVSKIEMSLVM